MANVKCTKCGNLITGVSAGQTIKCPKCGTSMKLASATATASPAQTVQNKSKKNKHPFTTWKLVSGILSIVFFFFVSLQSCAAGIGNAIMDNGEVSGSAGIMVAIFLLTGGIVAIATRNGGRGGDVALMVLYGLAAFLGFALAGSYTDLNIWAFWCLVCVIISIISFVKKKS